MHTWRHLSLIELATVIMVLYDKFIATGLKFTFDENPLFTLLQHFQNRMIMLLLTMHQFGISYYNFLHFYPTGSDSVSFISM